jgi:hypothetical protein
MEPLVQLLIGGSGHGAPIPKTRGGGAMRYGRTNLLGVRSLRSKEVYNES